MGVIEAGLIGPRIVRLTQGPRATPVTRWLCEFDPRTGGLWLLDARFGARVDSCFSIFVACICDAT